MKIGLKNPDLTFGQRLEALMQEDGIAISKTASLALSKRLYEKGILKYNNSDYDAQAKERDNARRQIDKHRGIDSATRISGYWLKNYCDYFQCSADYLFGYISLPTHEKSNMQNQTGLSKESIDKLFALYNTAGSKIDILDAKSCINIINGLLNSEDFFHLIKLINDADIAATSIQRYNDDISKILSDKKTKNEIKGKLFNDIDASSSTLAYSKFEIISLFQKMIEIRYNGFGYGGYQMPLKKDFRLSDHKNIDDLPLIGTF